MDDLTDKLIASLRETQIALHQELRPFLEAELTDRAMLMRLLDVAKEYAQHTRSLRRVMTASRADDDRLAEVDQICMYFDGAADLSVHEVGHMGAAARHLPDDKAD